MAILARSETNIDLIELNEPLISTNKANSSQNEYETELKRPKVKPNLNLNEKMAILAHFRACSETNNDLIELNEPLVSTNKANSSENGYETDVENPKLKANLNLNLNEKLGSVRRRLFDEPLIRTNKANSSENEYETEFKRPKIKVNLNLNGKLGSVRRRLFDEMSKWVNLNLNLNEKLWARKRMLKEFSMMDHSLSQCCFGPIDPNNIMRLQGIIVGPCGTPFEGGLFFLSIKIPNNYPFKPPKIKFKTKVFHPNISKNGKIHINVLDYDWSPALSVEKLLLSICSFLPNPDHEYDSCNPVCDLYWKNRKVYDQIARAWTLKYAML